MLNEDPVMLMIDDKPHLLAAMKRVLAGRLTTVFVRQGHYATAFDGLAIDPAPDLTIERIGDLHALALADFDAATATRGVDTVSQKPPETTSQEHL